VDAAYLNGAYKPMLDRRAELERDGFEHSALGDMLRTAQHHGIALHLFIPPSHARQAEIVRILGLEPLFHQWLHEVACVVSFRTATEPRQTPVTLWDFSGYNSVTTETIPPFSSKDHMRWYDDSVHFSRRTGRAILDKVLDLPASELPGGENFGAEVTPENVGKHFEQRGIDREHYLAAHPEIPTELAGLLEGEAAASPDPNVLTAKLRPCAAVRAKAKLA